MTKRTTDRIRSFFSALVGEAGNGAPRLEKALRDTRRSVADRDRT